ncbi:MAG: hypothetical protein JNK77_17125 [Saprospiraceae bacterium]|nr:hypothetical protein [Saprospiraceae bacterium]
MPITDIYLEPAGEDRRDRVLSYHIDFDQRIDERTGKPVGRPVLTQISIRIRRESEPAAPFYIDWMLDPTRQESLDISFYDNNQLVRCIRITEAYLVSYNQDCCEPGAIEETLILSPQQLEIDTIPFDRQDAA